MVLLVVSGRQWDNREYVAHQRDPLYAARVVRVITVGGVDTPTR